MTKLISIDSSNPDWPEAAFSYFAKSIPYDNEREGWQHSSLSAYQMGCNALVKPGYALETNWGAIPLDVSHTPSPEPRWDDVSVAVIKLANQRHELSYRRADGSPQLFVKRARAMTQYIAAGG